MKLVKIAAAVLNTTPLDWNGNRDRIVAAIEHARSEGVAMLCLPEMCISGYGCEDAFHSPGTADMAWRVLMEILPSTKGIVVSLGLPLLYQNALFNCAAMVADGKVLGFVAKRFLAGDGIHYEPRWFKPWPGGVVASIDIEGASYPLGDIYFNVGGVKVGFEICEDAWVAKRPGGALALEGVDVIFNPSASHFAFGKIEVRKRFVIEGSRAFGVTYVYSNLVGNEAGRAIYDGGAIIASAGRLVAQGPRFTFADHALTTAVVDVTATRMAQARTASFNPAIDGETMDCVNAAFDYPPTHIESRVIGSPAWETSGHIKEEEFARAEGLGLFDYLRKSRSAGFVVSLSGGADSSAISCLVRVMVELGVAELGLDAFLAKLAYFGRLKGADSVDAIMRQMLICVYQSTPNSGPVTRAAARGVAQEIAAEYLEFDVSTLHEGYVNMVGDALGRKLAWETDDIALQNIQARVRAPGVWMLANLRNALLVSTSNRSEAAVGYATMDGDTSGGLSPIAGIDKHYLRQWLVWMEKRGPHGLHTFPALRAVNVQAPTAELRPSDKHQTDEDDLMPYDLLDSIERSAIRDKKTPVEVFQIMKVAFGQYTPAQLGMWVERFFKLWCRNQWKRERYAPSFHLDDENLDPKTWCRFPILSGSYERELVELRRIVAES